MTTNLEKEERKSESCDNCYPHLQYWEKVKSSQTPISLTPRSSHQSI
jgi:hypothetical protein